MKNVLIIQMFISRIIRAGAKEKEMGKIGETLAFAIEMSKFKARASAAFSRSRQLPRLHARCHRRLRHVDPLTFRRSFDVYRINLLAYSLKFANTRRHGIDINCFDCSRIYKATMRREFTKGTLF